jgi:hypothetical protein
MATVFRVHRNGPRRRRFLAREDSPGALILCVASAVSSVPGSGETLERMSIAEASWPGSFGDLDVRGSAGASGQPTPGRGRFAGRAITGHQAFFTREALLNIAATTIDNITRFENNQPLDKLTG